MLLSKVLHFAHILAFAVLLDLKTCKYDQVQVDRKKNIVNFTTALERVGFTKKIQSRQFIIELLDQFN